MENQDTKNGNGIEIIIGEEGAYVQSANIPVCWCLQKELKEELFRRKVKNPHILFLIINNKYSYEVQRKLVPLKDGLTRELVCNSPGVHTLHAIVVWDNKGNYDNLWKRFIRRDSGCYVTDVLTPGGELIEDIEYSLYRVTLRFEVPKEVFAKEPKRWLKAWVNLWHRKSSRDQCQFRRRAIIAFFPLAKPLVVLLAMIFGTLIKAFCIIGLALCTFRNIDYSSLIHPFKNINRVWWDVKSDDRLLMGVKHTEDYKKVYQLYLFWLSPAVGLGWFIFVFIVMAFEWEYLSMPLFLSNVWLSVILWGCTVLLFAFVDFVLIFTSPIADKISKWYNNLITERANDALDKEIIALELLTCSKFELAPRVSALPPELRTKKLWFKEFKAAHCKPFAQ